MWTANVTRVHHRDVNVRSWHCDSSMTILLVLCSANQSELEQLLITSAWLPQCHPSRKTTCVKIHYDDDGNQAIHDQVGCCSKNMFLPTHFAGEKGYDGLTHLSGPKYTSQKRSGLKTRFSIRHFRAGIRIVIRVAPQLPRNPGEFQRHSIVTKK